MGRITNKKLSLHRNGRSVRIIELKRDREWEDGSQNVTTQIHMKGNWNKENS